MDRRPGTDRGLPSRGRAAWGRVRGTRRHRAPGLPGAAVGGNFRGTPTLVEPRSATGIPSEVDKARRPD